MAVRNRRSRGPYRLAGRSILAIMATVGVELNGSPPAGASTPSLSFSIVSSATGSCESVEPVCSDLAGGDVISVSGSGYAPDDVSAFVEECNDDASQPVMSFAGIYLPVSCTPVLLTVVSASRTLSTNFTVIQGTTGPPLASGTPICTEGGTPIVGCTTSGNAATDAADYPCPPTPAQVDLGDTCELIVSDVTGVSASGTLSFVAGATVLSTSLSGGGGTGTHITVTPGTPVTDDATLLGASPGASGTVTYTVYGDSHCADPVASGGSAEVTDGSVPASNPVAPTADGTYYWMATYSGDSEDPGGPSGCLSEVETVAGFGIITPSVLPPATPRRGYEVFLQAAGGAVPYYWQLTGGELPAGLHLHQFGVLAGILKKTASPGTYTFTVRARTHRSPRTSEQTSTRTFTLTLG
ncbi:MAG TPA: putative Ig domain-containing protein [Acidimicrobiales bacterium]|nr:putative Ig domain-containing protein [Acidimicrobiales bacterium]